MNKKGFTLVELLAVISILAIISVIVLFNVIPTINSAKNVLDNYQKNGIEDAVNRVVLEIINCDISDNTVEVLNNIINKNDCLQSQSSIIGKNISNIEVVKLVNNGYFDDKSHHCKGTISLYVDSNTYQVKVDTSNATCK